MTKFSRGVFVTFATQVACLVLTLGANIVITRTVGPEGKGVLTLITNYFLILVSIFTFGLSEGAVFFLGNRKHKHRDVFSSVIYASVLTTAIVIVLSLILRGWIMDSFLKDVGEHNYLIALLIFPAFYYFLCLRKILLGHSDLLSYNALIFTQTLLLLVFYIFLVPSKGVTGGIVSFIASLVAVDAVGTLYTSRRYGWPARVPSLLFFREGFIFGLKSQVGIVLSFFDRRFDVFIINIFLNPAAVGLYAIAVALAELPWRISDAVGTVLFPRVAGVEAKKAFSLIAQACRNTVFITVIMSLVLFAVAGVFIEVLFGKDFLPSLTALYMLLPGIVALSLNRVLCGGFSGLGRPEYGTYTVISSSISTIVLDLLLIPRMGIAGAALASSLAYLVSAVAAIVIFQRLSSTRLCDLLIIKKEDMPRYVALVQRPLHWRRPQ